MTFEQTPIAPHSGAYESPTLKTLEADQNSAKPRYSVDEPDAACTSCPIAMWYVAGEDLECFCSALHQVVWSLKSAAIKLCDAREQEIARLRISGHTKSSPAA